MDNPDSLIALKKDWNELTRNAGAAAPFMRAEWIHAWWNAFGETNRLHVVTVWQDNRLVGLLPLMFGQTERYGMIVRRLGALTNAHSPRFEAPHACDVEGVMEVIWAHVRSLSRQWDIFELPGLMSASPTLQALCHSADSDSVSYGLWEAEQSPFITLESDWEQYLATRSRNFRKDLKRKLRRLENLGPVRLKIISDPIDVLSSLEVAFDIEAQSWKGREGTAMQSNERVCQFYRDLASGLASGGELCLHFLTINGMAIAFDLSIRYDGRLYSIKSGYQDTFAHASPGLVLLGMMLKHYIDTDIHEIDLLGEQDDFKRRWTDQSRPHLWFICAARSPRGRLFQWLKFGITPWLRRLKKDSPTRHRQFGVI
ncbi:GNAT family N-acetyltransferase [Wenzhouxiangella sp. AB-CW3]|uniref:GNAT family N-acetyltransferase n=1 Tax=Wenzhouxiangella sp. AB-CW3 TaxID=2771012 RepID=UPI00168B190D|nr:GNAT family N-acetyltransferase [Wenzhouxiangella sp. AB-CW3]QOC24073.1 GNAT family N-acetyltransferase [Wenzhouxiangella sp. AB-CW3]